MSEQPTEAARHRAALMEIAMRREAWYDAMGDDEASAPNEEAEECWDIAIAALGDAAP